MKRLVVVLLIASLTQTVAFGQKKNQKTQPAVKTPTVYRGVGTPPPPPDPRSVADLKWFEIFRDQRLQDLIRLALENNYDLREAIARVDLASANYGITRSDRFPTFTGSADFVTEKLSRSGQLKIPEPIETKRTFGSVLLNLLTFELDIWGRVRKATEAAKADLLASEETRRAVITTVVSDVATAYFNLRELDFELEIANRTLASRQESLRIINLRQQRGVATMLDVRQAEELVYDATEVIPALERAIEQNENFISFLIGANPEVISTRSQS